MITSMEASNIKKRMINGMFWSFSGTAFAKFITLVGGIVCAHILEKETYGEFSMVRSTINMFVVLGSAGLGVTATKYISEYKKEEKEKIPHLYFVANYFATITGLICTILILIFSSFLAQNILHNEHLSTPLKIGAILLFLSIINGVQNGTLYGFEDFKAIAINTLFGSICEALFMLAGAMLYGINGAILGFGIGFVAIFITNKLSINKQFKQNGLRKVQNKSLTQEDWSILKNYSLPAALSSLLIAPSFWIIRSMLVRTDGFGELAIFEAADQWKVIILFIPTAISQIVLPILSSLNKEGIQTFSHTLILNCIIIAAASILISILVILASPYAMQLYGKGFNNSIPLKILAVSTIFSAVANVLEMSIYSLGKMWQCFTINIVWAVGMIGTTYFLLHKGMGAIGLSTAVLLAYILSCSIFAGYTWYLVVYLKTKS